MRRSFHTRLTLVLTALFFMTGVAQAQNAILVVDSAKVISDSSAGKSIYAQLSAIQKTLEAEAKSTLSPLDSQKQSIQAQTQGLSMQDLQARPDLTQQIQSLQEQGAKAQVEMQYKGAEMEATERKAVLALNKKISEVIVALAKERGAAVVMNKTMMFYSSSTIDVTQEVISRMNRQTPNMTVTRERLPRKS